MGCDPQTLVSNAACIQSCVPEGLQIPILIALAAQLAGVPSDPQSLSDMAQCIRCKVPPGMEWPVLVALGCQIAGV